MGAGDAGATTGDAGSRDPAYRGGAVGWVVGACGAGAAGSEIQPYLEGGIEEAALSGGGAGVGAGHASATTGDAGSGDPAYV